ncbi:MAG: LamG domain-containing protein [Nitrospiraceae bacterium]|nr:MAG: LamG domain-containing protein [Nitrospiraceae bacterium]
MKIIKLAKRMYALFLVSGILLLCTGFIFISCGKGPQTKVQLIDAGDFALDFSKTPEEGEAYIANQNLFRRAQNCPRGLGISAIPPFDVGECTRTVDPNVKEFTVEGWIKRKTSGALNGGILSRFDVGGLSLYVKNNKPKLAILIPVTGTATFTAASADDLQVDNWTHVAGVLVNENHGAVVGHPACSGGQSETPHLDLYVDGVLKSCGRTWGGSGSNPEITAPQFAPDDGGDGQGYMQIYMGAIPFQFSIDGLDDQTKLEAVLDDIRFWTVARTQAEIQQCMNTKLTLSGTCTTNDANLKGYWAFNEGTGSTANDSSGQNNASSIVSPHGENTIFTGAWVTDTPF